MARSLKSLTLMVAGIPYKQYTSHLLPIKHNPASHMKRPLAAHRYISSSSFMMQGYQSNNPNTPGWMSGQQYTPSSNQNLTTSWDGSHVNRSPVPLAPSKPQSLPPRLGSTAGRSVAVRGGDVAGAFLQLRRICNENFVAREASQQRFYERPGLKRKRLRRERFRRRFKQSFKRMVNTVLEMKRQGI